MSDNEWKDANPEPSDLPNKGKSAIAFIFGGIAMGLITIIGMKFRSVGIAAGGFSLISGIVMFMRMRIQRQPKPNYKLATLVTAAGFLMLLASGVRVVTPFAAYILITGAIGLVVIGLWKAIKLSWDVGKSS